MASELLVIAGTKDLSIIAYLLDMVRVEAQATARRLRTDEPAA